MEINAINTKKHFVVATGTNLFPTEYKSHELNRSTGVRQFLYRQYALNFAEMCIVLWVSRMSGLYPVFRIKMMDIKVVEVNAHKN